MTDRTPWDIDHPPVVVLVGSRVRPELEDALRTRTPYRIETAKTAAEARTRLEDRPLVDCLWLPQELPGTETTGVELAATVRSIDSDVSILLAPSAERERADDAARLASEATAAGVSEYVRADATVDDCLDRLETAVDRAVERRTRSVKSDVLDVALSAFDVSIYAKDDRARHLLYSDRAEGPAPEAVFGKTDVEAYPEQEEARRTYEDDLNVIETGEPVSGRLEQYTYGDDRHWWLTTKVPWTGASVGVDGGTGVRTGSGTDSGSDRGSDAATDPSSDSNADSEFDRDPSAPDPRGLVGISIDVTEFKRRERDLLTRVTRLEQYPDFVTHDLRNPLQIASGYLELAREGDRSALDRVEAALHRIEGLLEDFESIRTDTTVECDDVRPISFAPLVERVWSTAATETATLENALEPETFVVATETLLRLLLENLFKNACTHAGPDVTVRVGTLEDGFYVEDDGPGIPDAAVEDVFEYGYTTSDDGTGTGIGLSIVHEAAVEHGWTRTVTESDEGGARFEIRSCMTGTALSVTEREAIELDEHADVGDVAVPGSATADDEPGRYRLRAGGENVWQDVDEFTYRYATVDGGVRIQGRIVDIRGPSRYSKGLFAIRAGLEESDAYCAIGATRDAGSGVLWRSEPDEPATLELFEGTDPVYEWFRLERLGDQVCVSVSADGERWLAIDRRSISLSDPVVVGLAACSVEPETACEVTFEGVSASRIDVAEGESE